MRRSSLALAVVLGLALPATASAATLTVSGGTLTFQAAPGESNDVDVHDLFDPVRGPGLTVTDGGAALTADASCDAGPPLLCPIGPIAMHLGDRDDQASVISIEDDASVWGDDGDDDILASGLTTVASGGSGSDHLQVNSNGNATANGGTGNDVIEAASSFRALAYGDSGSDIIIQGRAIQAILDGGSGSDAVIGLPRASGSVEAQGGTGADLLAIQSTGGTGPIADWTLGGGDGDDLIAGGPGADTISGGAGRDHIYAAGGGADTVRCGSGFDVVRADADDTVADDCESVRITSASSVPSSVARARKRAAAVAAR
jgi:Ca2+-binding RTX toxin-like protein